MELPNNSDDEQAIFTLANHSHEERATGNERATVALALNQVATVPQSRGDFPKYPAR